MSESTFTVKAPIRFHQADPAGILFFGHVYRLAHDAYEDFVRHLGFEWKQWFTNEEWAVPIRHSSCEYFAPLRPGEIYEIAVSIEKIGQTSFISKYLFALGKTAHCEVTLVHAFLDKKTSGKMLIPSGIRERLKPYQSESLATK